MYESIEELTDTMRDTLPEEAQKIYVEAYNEAWEDYDPEKTQMSQDAAANRAGWAAVKQDFTQDEETRKWYPAGEVPEHEEEEDEGLLDKLEDAF